MGGADIGLQVLDAHAHCKRLGFHGDARVKKHAEGIPGRVARSQRQSIRLQRIGAGWRIHRYSREHAAPNGEAGETVFEPDVAAQAQQLQTDVPHHLHEHVGADVGLVGIADILRRAVYHQGFHHGGKTGVMGPGGQLSVGEGPGPALAELDVGGGVQRTPRPKGGYVAAPLLHGTAPLQNNGGQASTRQKKGGKEPGRAHAHHHGPERCAAGGGGKAVGMGRMERDGPVLCPPD